MAQVWYRGAFAVCSLVIYITSPIARFCDQQPLSTNHAMYGMLPIAPHTRVGYLITQTPGVLIFNHQHPRLWLPELFVALRIIWEFIR